MKNNSTKSWWYLAVGIISGLLGAAIMLLFNSQPRGEAVVILNLDSVVPREVMEQIRSLDNIWEARLVDLR